MLLLRSRLHPPRFAIISPILQTHRTYAGKRVTKTKLSDLATPPPPPSPPPPSEAPTTPEPLSVSYTSIPSKPSRKNKINGKRTTTLSLSDLPQGPLAPLPSLTPSTPPTPRYPTVMQQAFDTMSQLPSSTILLTRVGGFYELYFSHATEFAPKLGLKLATKFTQRGNVPLAGFPTSQLQRYLKMLVEDEGKFVAVAEEFPVEGEGRGGGGRAEGGLMFERRVARVITPGTLMDEEWVSKGSGNFLVAVEVAGDQAGLAWTDLGTGDWWCEVCGLEELVQEVVRIAPREVVVRDKALVKGVEGCVVTEFEGAGGVDWEEVIEDGEGGRQVMDELEEVEKRAGDKLLAYVKDRLPGLVLKLQPPVRKDRTKEMRIDANSMRALEIRQTFRDGRLKGSLLNVVDRTVTKAGKRLLTEWIVSPSTHIPTIEARLNTVEAFKNNDSLRTDLIAALDRSHDSQRILQKLSMGRGDTDDLIALAKTMEATAAIQDRLKQVNDNKTIAGLAKAFEIPTKLAKKILDAIDEEGLREKQRVEENEAAEIKELAAEAALEEMKDEIEAAESETKTKKATKWPSPRGVLYMKEENRERVEPWVMQRNASPTLKSLHAKLDELHHERNEMEENLRNDLDCPTLTLRWSPKVGHYIHSKARDSAHLSTHSSVRPISTSKSTHTFHLTSWTTLGLRIDQVRLQIRAAEQTLFSQLRNLTIRQLRPLRRNAHILATLDVTTSFALLAIEKNLIRPNLTTSRELSILSGRHITVESGLASSGRSFTSNSLFLCATPNHPNPALKVSNDPPSQASVWLITGPNMAGKSTFLRQNALIIVLAQTGSFVPATHATIGLVDALFSRVGSADNLFADQSTFMVEMLETATILRNATDRSFVVMDEVGRGTTAKDGEAVAGAVLEYLVKRVKCRGLFATHFHGVWEMLQERGVGGVEAWCTDLVEGERGWSYVHRLRSGVNRESHALKVAGLAGVPEEVVRVARERLRQEGLEGVGE